MTTNYILFILQDGSLETRSMIVPTEPFLKLRQKEYNILKDYSVQTSCGLNASIFTVVDNLVLQPISCEKSGEVVKEKPFTNFYRQLLKYAEGLEEGCYFDEKDTEWYDKTIIQLCEGTNHVENYVKCKNMPSKSATKIKFTDSFLILEKRITKTKLLPEDVSLNEQPDNSDTQSCQSDNTISTKSDNIDECQDEYVDLEEYMKLPDAEL